MVTALRTIREEPEATEVLEKFRKDHSRFGDFWTGWSWRLVRLPYKNAYQLPKYSQWRIVKTIDFMKTGLPELIILYKVDENYIDIQSIRVIDS